MEGKTKFSDWPTEKIVEYLNNYDLKSAIKNAKSVYEMLNLDCDEARFELENRASDVIRSRKQEADYYPLIDNTKDNANITVVTKWDLNEILGVNLKDNWRYYEH